jgi:hypothetical protein
VAEFNGTPLATTFVSATQETAVVPAADNTTPGTYSLTVVTPGPHGGTSNAFNYFVLNPQTATITGLSTTAGFENSTFTVVITGSGFAPGAMVTFGAFTLTPTSITPTKVTFTVTPADEGVVNIAAVNPGESPSNSATFTLQEELLPDGTRGTANQRFLSEVYRDLLHRDIDPAGLASFGSLLDAGASRISVVLAIEQDSGHEFLQVEVKDAYLQYLHRALDVTDFSPNGDVAGLKIDVAYLANGHSVEQLDALIVSSQEYQSKAASRGGFTTAFYEDALGRGLGAPNDPPASPPLTPDQIAAVFTSPEYYQHLASAYYLRFLDRPFGPGDDVRAGTADGVEMAEIIGDLIHVEFFNKTA